MAGSEAPEDGAQLIIVISGEVASHSLRLTHDMGEEIKSWRLDLCKLIFVFFLTWQIITHDLFVFRFVCVSYFFSKHSEQI